MTNDRNAASCVIGTPNRTMSEPLRVKGLAPVSFFAYFLRQVRKYAVGSIDKVKIYAKTEAGDHRSPLQRRNWYIVNFHKWGVEAPPPTNIFYNSPHKKQAWANQACFLIS